MLGTNDLQVPFQAIPLTVARGAEALVHQFLSLDWPPENRPKLLLVSPIHIGDVSVNPVFGRCSAMSARPTTRGELAPYYKEIADRLGCEFFDAASVACPSPVDGLHMDPSEHEKLARALAEKVQKML